MVFVYIFVCDALHVPGWMPGGCSIAQEGGKTAVSQAGHLVNDRVVGTFFGTQNAFQEQFGDNQ